MPASSAHPPVFMGVVAMGIVVMGVSGCGKSTLAAGLATALGWAFIEGDLLHPAANIAKMSAGIALTDADRAPFLAHVAEALVAEGGRAVASCSALKRTYRDAIRARAGAVRLVHPVLPEALLLARLAARQDHFMPATLLHSQLATLEPPAADEQAITVDGALPPAEQVAVVLRALDAGA